jgi:hypothetical protein
MTHIKVFIKLFIWLDEQGKNLSNGVLTKHFDVNLRKFFSKFLKKISCNNFPICEVNWSRAKPYLVSAPNLVLLVAM